MISQRDLFSPLPTEYDIDKVGNYVVPGQNPIIKLMNPFLNIPLPEPGFWLVRLKRDSAWCPAAIMRLQTACEPSNTENHMERSPFLAAFISGEPVDLEEVWHRRGRLISENAYWLACQEIDRARSQNIYDPRAYPRRPIKMGAMPLPTRNPRGHIFNHFRKEAVTEGYPPQIIPSRPLGDSK